MRADNQSNETPGKPQYVGPTITVMTDEEVLKTFQVTSAGVSWWAGQV